MESNGIGKDWEVRAFFCSYVANESDFMRKYIYCKMSCTTEEAIKLKENDGKKRAHTYKFTLGIHAAILCEFGICMCLENTFTIRNVVCYAAY